MRWLAIALIFSVLLPMPWVLPPLVRDCRYSMIEDIVEGDLDGVRRALDAGCDPNHNELGLRSPLQRAIDAGQIDIAVLLVEHGSTLAGRLHDDDELLSWAAERGALNLMRALLDRGADPNYQTDYYRLGALHWVRGDKGPVVKLLVEAGADPDLQDKAGRTPLHRVRDADLPVAAALIEAGAELEIVDSLGHTPLARAVTLGRSEVAELLIQNGADLHTVAGDGSNLLHLAVYGASTGLITRLLAAGLDPDAVDVHGTTALQMAVLVGRPDVVQLFLDAGADLEARETDGRTPLQTAAITGNLQVARVLLEAGADPNQGDVWNHTPLHEAAFTDDVPMGRLLLQHGARADARATYGWNLSDVYTAGRTATYGFVFSGR